MYGSKFVRDLIGTRTNVVKPKQFDSNAPTKNTYSEDAFKDPKLLDTIEEKIIEYAPFQITNRSRNKKPKTLQNTKRSGRYQGDGSRGSASFCPVLSLPPRSRD